jgi:hypothetical protein
MVESRQVLDDSFQRKAVDPAVKQRRDFRLIDPENLCSLNLS